MPSKAFLVMRGIQGSGKSTLAESLQEHCEAHHPGVQVSICSNDHYWEQTGREFSMARLDKAIALCASEVRQAGEDGAQIIIVDNTHLVEEYFTQFFDEVEDAKSHWNSGFKGYKICLVNLTAKNEGQAKKCGKRNQHGLSRSFVVSKMHEHETLRHYPHQIELQAPLRGEGKGVKELVSWLAARGVLPKGAADACEEAESEESSEEDEEESDSDEDYFSDFGGDSTSSEDSDETIDLPLKAPKRRRVR